MPRYNHATIEPKWQAFWDKNQTFAAPRLPKPGSKKLYALDMFPYPSGDGLHVGHPEGYTATDIVCRAARMQGKSVMHPMGFDAFGLPAEEHAIKTGQHPRIQTEKNIGTFRRQLKSLGFSYDWSRELATTDIEYFRWTQWIFLQIYDTWFDEEQHRGRPISELQVPDHIKAIKDTHPVLHDAWVDEQRLAYQSEAPVNWCPALGTVLANEEVIDGKSERGDYPVVRMPLRQWKLRITAYADRLERDLETLDWPEGIKALQRNWIGKSTGAEVDFVVTGFGNPHSLEFKPFEKRPTLEEWKEFRTKSGFPEKSDANVLRVYTTRPDTLCGATYVVISPEHPFATWLSNGADGHIAKSIVKQIDDYRLNAASKSDLDRTELAKEKTGVFSGQYAWNPVTGTPAPIWIADYVLASYGTGAIMAVPAHDERDFEFANQFELPIKAVVDPGAEKSQIEEEQTNKSYSLKLKKVDRQAVLEGRECYPGNGIAINSGKYDGLTTAEVKKKITADLAERGLAHEAVNYKLRDWLFSRQRFWGEPFPILHELDAAGKPTGRIRAVDEKDLPVDLPHLDDFKPHGRPEPPLDKAPDEWLYPVIDGKCYKRETNTMPQWAGSCWYYLRFLNPKDDKAAVDQAIEKAWMPVDLYIGGAEHAVLHLLYARFWHMVLYDRGIVSTPEPFQKLVNQGMILGETEYRGAKRDGEWISHDRVPKDAKDAALGKVTWEFVQVDEKEVTKVGDSYVLRENPTIKLLAITSKMSKSRDNVINPDDVVKEYGADSLRLYEMFMGPLEATKPWNMQGVNGVFGFLNRVWRLVLDERAETMTLNPAVVDRAPNADENRILHQTIQAVTNDIGNLAFNTAISRMMEFTNYFTTASERPREALEKLVLLLSPFAPHIAEELWHALGHKQSLAYEPWPEFDPTLAKEDTVEVPVQINGKLRAKITVATDADKAELESAARADEKVRDLLSGKQLVKVIVVPGRLVNFVIKG